MTNVDYTDDLSLTAARAELPQQSQEQVAEYINI